MSDPGVFNVAQLKEFLRARGLSTTGAKAELAARLMEADPSGDWMTGKTRTMLTTVPAKDAHSERWSCVDAKKRSPNVSLGLPSERSLCCVRVKV